MFPTDVPRCERLSDNTGVIQTISNKSDLSKESFSKIIVRRTPYVIFLQMQLCEIDHSSQLLVEETKRK